MLVKLLAYDVSGEYYKSTPELEKLVKRPKDTIISDWWYLHGELETTIGYDKAKIINIKELPTITKNCYYNGNDKYFDVVCLKDGIYDVEVHGISKPCIGYFWITEMEDIPKLRGLVCFKDDKEAVEYAKKKYEEKSVTI